MDFDDNRKAKVGNKSMKSKKDGLETIKKRLDILYGRKRPVKNVSGVARTYKDEVARRAKMAEEKRSADIKQLKKEINKKPANTGQEDRILWHGLPIRENVSAFVCVPRDLTLKEVKAISAFLTTLVLKENYGAKTNRKSSRPRPKTNGL